MRLKRRQSSHSGESLLGKLFDVCLQAHFLIKVGVLFFGKDTNPEKHTGEDLDLDS